MLVTEMKQAAELITVVEKILYFCKLYIHDMFLTTNTLRVVYQLWISLQGIYMGH